MKSIMQTNRLSIFFVLFIILFLMSTSSCRKNNDINNDIAEFTLSTGEISQLNGNFAVASGKLRMTAGKVITYGHCWSTYTQPTFESDFKTDFGSESQDKEYFSEMKNLKPGTFYHVRAYAKDKDKVTYGNEVIFKTPNFLVSGINVANQSYDFVNIGATITIYDDAVVKHGFCWATHDNPSVFDSKKEFTTVLSETEGFYAKISGLTSKTTYYFRAYAESGQMAYGPVISLYINNINLKDNTLEQINDSSVSLNTEINFTDENIIEHGHCYSANPNPDIESEHTELGRLAHSGTFSSEISDLQKGETYYFRAYVQTNDTIIYSEEIKYKLIFPLFISNFSGAGRSGALSFTINGNNYVGFGQSNRNDIWMYDLENNTWVQKSSYPGNLYNSQAYAVSNAGHAFILAYSKVFGKQYIPETDSWEALPTIELGFNGNDISSFFSNNRLFVSATDSYNNVLHLYELVGEEWVEKSSREYLTSDEYFAFELDGKAYWANTYSNFSHYLWEYDISSDIWHEKATPPVIEYYYLYKLTHFSYHGKGYILYSPSSYDEVDVYDPATDAWGSAKPYTQTGSVSIIVNDNVFIGLELDDQQFYYYNPEDK